MPNFVAVQAGLLDSGDAFPCELLNHILGRLLAYCVGWIVEGQLCFLQCDVRALFLCCFSAVAFGNSGQFILLQQVFNCVTVTYPLNDLVAYALFCTASLCLYPLASLASVNHSTGMYTEPAGDFPHQSFFSLKSWAYMLQKMAPTQLLLILYSYITGCL